MRALATLSLQIPVRAAGKVRCPLKQLESLAVGFLAATSTASVAWARRKPPPTAMTHIAIQEALNGKLVDWMEKVSDEQYQK